MAEPISIRDGEPYSSFDWDKELIDEHRQRMLESLDLWRQMIEAGTIIGIHAVAICSDQGVITKILPGSGYPIAADVGAVRILQRYVEDMLLKA